MKISIAKILLALLLILVGCIGSSKLRSNEVVDISNKTFIFESDIRTISFIFDTVECQLGITYKCTSIRKENEKISINCTYKQLNDSIIVIKNKLYDTKSGLIDLTPPKEELEKCVSSDLTKHSNRKNVSAWANDDGFIPIIGIDTIKVFSKKNKLFLYLSKRRGVDIYNFLWEEK